jgi:type IV secretory pathway VirB10-like protein
MIKLIKRLKRLIIINKWIIMFVLAGVLLLNILGMLGTKEREGVDSDVKGEAPSQAPKPQTLQPTGYDSKSKAHMKWEKEINFEKAKRAHYKEERERADRENKAMDREREKQRLSKMKRGAERRETARAEAKKAKAEAKKRKEEEEAEKKKEKKEEEKEAKKEQGDTGMMGF